MSEPGLHITIEQMTVAGQQLLRDLTVDAGPGEVVTLMGPSGCGKSTALTWISGAHDTSVKVQGQVLLNATDITDLQPERRRIGILFQDDMLFPHMSVLDNMLFAIPRHQPGRREQAQEALNHVALAETADRFPATLSGGQRARAALVRALLAEPKALLLDEPFSSLDQALRDEMRRFVFEHVRNRRLPAILVTHDPADAKATGGPVLQPWR